MSKWPKPTVFASLAILLIIPALLSAGCEEESSGQRFRAPKTDKVRPGQSSIDARERINNQGGAGLVEKGGDQANMDSLPLPVLSERDFIEGPKHRDPFNPVVELLTKDKGDKISEVQREIKLREWDVSELRLIAIITNIGDPRVMVTTPANEGIVLRRGDYIGKADYVDPGSGGEKIQVNWRVARIHGSGKEEERGIYLVRDDPLTPTPEDVTRFMPLHPRQ